MSTPAQLAACAANAQLSTGPRSPEGKAVSSRNAIKLGLYAQAAILPGEDPDELAELTRQFEDRFHPAGLIETRLVADLVQAIWLERRYTRIEAEVIHLGFAALSPQERQFPLGAVYLQDAKGPHVLEKLRRRRDAARRQFQRALTELRQLQPEPRNPHPANARSAPSVRFDKPPATPKFPAYTGGPTPVHTPKDCWDNPALRL